MTEFLKQVVRKQTWLGQVAMAMAMDELLEVPCYATTMEKEAAPRVEDN